MASNTQYRFDGTWAPSADPATIGINNFASLENMRPCDGGIRPVKGYTSINTTPVSAHPLFRSGIQLRNKYGDSYVLVWTEDGYVIENRTAIPSQGDFESTVWHTDASGADIGRFSKAPAFNIVYCNSKENRIWAGTQMRLSGFVTMDDGAFDGAENPKDFSEIINDELQTTGHYVSIGTQKFFLCLTTRKAKGFKFYIKTANASASSMTCKVYTGSWTAVSNPVDGTSVGGKALAQTGTFSFDSTVANAIPFHYNGAYTFAYLFEISAGTAEIYHATADCPPQAFCDIWDGTNRQLLQFQVKFNGVYEDYTADILDTESYAVDPIGAELDGLTATDAIDIVSDERLAGLMIKMAPQRTNLAASVMTVSYWTGSAYASCSAIDWTQNPAGDTLGQGGYVTWNPPAVTAEVKQELFGSYGYTYRITFSATLTGTHGDATRSVILDQCWGIPAQREVPLFKFCVPFRDRLLGCGAIEENEGNRIDITPTYAPDTWNGVESSMFGLQSLYAQTEEDLSAGISLFNRFGNNIFMVVLLFTNNTTHILSGEGPEDFKVEEIAPLVGCPAPQSLCLANIGFSMSQDVTRNVALWVSFSGPMMFDGSLMSPVIGVENYFDRTKPECINYDYIYKARSWIDPIELIWHVEIPSGQGQSENNVHLGYDLVRKNRPWFRYNYVGTRFPKCGFPVIDSNGVTYIYGGIDNGTMIRMEDGSSFGGENILYSWEHGDSWLSNNVWEGSQIREFKFICRRGDTNLTVDVYDCYDTYLYTITNFEWIEDNDFGWLEDDDFEWITSTAVDLTNEKTSFSVTTSNERRLFIGTNNVNFEGRTHRFKFVVDNMGLDSTFMPLGYGLAWQESRKDIKES